MKKEPKFRGKSIETNEWVYGCGWYHIDYTEEHKKENNMSERANLLTKSGFVECHLDSMGRYTGLKDKNGVEIYEGDIVKYPFLQSFKDDFKVVFHEGAFMVKQENIRISIRELAFRKLTEVIGNVYDNLELIE